MDTRTLLLLGSVGLAGYAACMVYDPSLINGPPGTSGGGGSGIGGGSGSESGPGSGSSTASGPDGGGTRVCTTSKDCPGEDDACKTRACSNAGACGFDFTQAGTQVPPPTPDCKVAVCDGQGAVKCVPDHCIDMELSRDETDVDCGGTTCPKCAIGNKCMTGDDCLSGSCPSGTCAPSCTDGIKNGDETDKDCGGACPDCAIGQGCAIDGDCLSGKCSGGVCANVPTDTLLISEIQTRGDNQGNDEFIEIYNPTAAPVTFDDTWTVSARSAVGSCGASMERFAGGGQVIPPHGHLLFANKAPAPSYNGLTKEDGAYTVGVTDAGEVVLRHGATVVDAVCFFYDVATQDNLKTCSPASLCEGTPVSNLPHNNSGTGTGSNTDVTLSRKPGSALGNGQDTGDNSSDFASGFLANPQNLASPATPP